MFIFQLDSICTRNQQHKEIFRSNDALLVTTTANLARERNVLCENQQQLIGDQASLEYVSSCSNRAHVPQDLTPIFNRSVQTDKVCAMRLLKKHTKNLNFVFVLLIK